MKLTKQELEALINMLVNAAVKVGEAQFFIQLLAKLQEMHKEENNDG